MLIQLFRPVPTVKKRSSQTLFESPSAIMRSNRQSFAIFPLWVFPGSSNSRCRVVTERTVSVLNTKNAGKAAEKSKTESLDAKRAPPNFSKIQQSSFAQFSFSEPGTTTVIIQSPVVVWQFQKDLCNAGEAQNFRKAKPQKIFAEIEKKLLETCTISIIIK